MSAQISSKTCKFSIDNLMKPDVIPPELCGTTLNGQTVSVESAIDSSPLAKRRKTDNDEDRDTYANEVTSDEEDLGDNPDADSTGTSACAMHSLAIPVGVSPLLASVKCHLDNKDLWSRFHTLGTEMIITKAGRRMFPTVRLAFSGLNPLARYSVVVDIVPLDDKRYRYAYHRSSWLVAGKADPPLPPRLYAHPDGPFTGTQLSKQVITFEKLKLTNNEMDKTTQIVLNSMHKYQPRIHVVLVNDGETFEPTPSEMEHRHYKTFVFSDCQFTAVTAYQNQLITKLKIDSNPFAKGFRDSTRLTDYESFCREHVPSSYSNHILMTRLAAAASFYDQSGLAAATLMGPLLQANAMRFPTNNAIPNTNSTFMNRLIRPQWPFIPSTTQSAANTLSLLNAQLTNQKVMNPGVEFAQSVDRVANVTPVLGNPCEKRDEIEGQFLTVIEHTQDNSRSPQSITDLEMCKIKASE